MKSARTVRNLASMLCVVGLGAASACSPPDALPPAGPPTPGPAARSAATTTDCRSDGTGTICTPCGYPGLSTLLPHDTDDHLGNTPTDGTYGTNPSAPYCYAPPKGTANNLLFVFLPGSFAVPTQYQMILYQARALGYHVLSLSYPNAATNGPAPVTDPDPTEICEHQSLGCWDDLRWNRWDGRPEQTLPKGADPYLSTQVNAIGHRLTQALRWLAQNDHEPGAMWSTFLTDGNPRWAGLVVAGHSQGGGMAAFIGSRVHVKGVVTFSEPNDATYVGLGAQSTCASPPSQLQQTASWVTTPFASTTPLGRYIGLLGCSDLTFTQTVTVWNKLAGPTNSTPGYPLGNGPPTGVIIDPSGQPAAQPPYMNSHRLFTNAKPTHADGTTTSLTDPQSASHDATVVDCRFAPGCSTLTCTPSPSAPPNCGCSATTSAPASQCVPSPMQGDYATPLCTTPNKKLTNADGTPNPQLKPAWQQMLITAGGLDSQKWAPALACDQDATTP